MSNLKTPPFIIMDFETGGFSSQQNAVTEYAAVSIFGDTLEIISEIEGVVTYYDDSLIYEDQALLATHITHEMIKNGIELKTFVNQIIEFFQKSTPFSHTKYKPILVGHNILFDVPFLQQIFTKTKKDLSKYIAGKTDYYGNFTPQYLDTITLAQLLWGNDETMTNHKLIDCINKAKLELVNAHRAMNDVVATKDLLVYYINTMRSGLNGNQSQDNNTFRKNFKF